jgi:hypothetical protein
MIKPRPQALTNSFKKQISPCLTCRVLGLLEFHRVFSYIRLKCSRLCASMCAPMYVCASLSYCLLAGVSDSVEKCGNVGQSNRSNTCSSRGSRFGLRSFPHLQEAASTAATCCYAWSTSQVSFSTPGGEG